MEDKLIKTEEEIEALIKDATTKDKKDNVAYIIGYNTDALGLNKVSTLMDKLESLPKDTRKLIHIDESYKGESLADALGISIERMKAMNTEFHTALTAVETERGISSLNMIVVGRAIFQKDNEFAYAVYCCGMAQPKDFPQGIGSIFS